MPGLWPRLAGAAIGVLAGAALATGAAGAAGGVTATPATVLASVVAAANKQQSVHYVVVSSFGNVVVTQVSDVGRTRGIQRITYHQGGKSGHVTLIVTAPGVFLEGDDFALSRYMGFTTALAKKDANKLLFVARTSREYASLAAAVTLPSFLSELKLRAPLANLPETTFDGQRALAIGGVEAVVLGSRYTATLYASASGGRLPLEETVRHGSTRVTITLSRWNETLNLTLPSTGKPTTAPKLGPGLVA